METFFSWLLKGFQKCIVFESNGSYNPNIMNLSKIELYAVQCTHGWMTGRRDHGRIEPRLISIRHTESIRIDSPIESIRIDYSQLYFTGALPLQSPVHPAGGSVRRPRYRLALRSCHEPPLFYILRGLWPKPLCQLPKPSLNLYWKLKEVWVSYLSISRFYTRLRFLISISFSWLFPLQLLLCCE